MKSPNKTLRTSAILSIFAIILLCFASCSRKVISEQVYVDRYHTDTIRLTSQRLDSVYLKDSVFVFQKGDTLLITKYIDRYKYKTITDTIYKARVDTVTNIRQVIVEKQLTKWQKFKQDIGGYAITISCLAIAVIAFLLILPRFKRKD